MQIRIPNLFLTLFIFFLCSCSSGSKVGVPLDTNFVFKNNVRNTAGRLADSYVASSSKVMIVTGGGPATDIGLSILKKGGNAVDAAIAVSFALGVYRPQSTGIGGGGFAFVVPKRGADPVFLDFRERAPKWATAEIFQIAGRLRAAPKSHVAFTGTPGLVAGLAELFVSYGSRNVPWEELVMPSVKLAREGFEVYPNLVSQLSQLKARGVLSYYGQTGLLFSKSNGSAYKVGDTFRNPNLARSLELIAKHGPDGFYSGPVARGILDEVQSRGGALTKEDLEGYQVRYRKPIKTKYRGFEIVGAPLPSSGGITNHQTLKVLERFDFSEQGPGDTFALSLRGAAMKRAFTARAQFLGDDDFVEVPVDVLLSDDFSAQLADGIDRPRSTESENDSIDPIPTSTTHFAVIDEDGMVVSSTQSINHLFGSGIVAGKTGILLNNTLDDFSAPGQANQFGLIGGSPNKIQGGKTPLSSMSPTLVFEDGEFYMTLGSPGGPRIINAVLNVLVNKIDFGMSLREAVFAPRIHQQSTPDVLYLDEGGFSSKTMKELEKLGHNVQETKWGVGNITAIAVEGGKVIGVADPRSEGTAGGY